MNYEPGSRVGDYEILAVLGAGGMGRVYKVRNVISDRVEAMKVLLPDLTGDTELADRFMREIKVQARLQHPNIAALYTALRIENQLLMFMEYVEGATLENTLQSGPLPVAQAVDYLAQVLAALAYAHAHGVVHRDLKPANIMVLSGGLVKLMDFGIAKIVADRKLTQTGRTVGSLYYMSPEQIQGALDLDPRSDLYSLGVTLYEAVTGARPFQGDSEYSIMAAHLQGSPAPPLQVSPNLPQALNDVILLALEKDPARRFQTADAFRSALLSVVQPQPAVSEPPPPATLAPPPAPRRRGLWIAVGSLATIAVLMAGITQIPKLRHTQAESQAAPIAAPEAAKPLPQSPELGTAPAPFEHTQPSAPPAIEERAAVAGRSAAKSSAKPSPAPVAPAQLPAATPTQPEPVPVRADTPPAPAEAPRNAAELNELRRQLMLLDVRAGVVRASLDNLRREQARLGLGLRSDMVAAADRMGFQLNETDAALKRGDLAAARQNLDFAEREVSRIETFLGK